MKKTVLKYVQNILSAMDSDNVSSIDDTVESYQVAGALQTIFDQIIDEYDLPAIHTEFRLVGGSDTTEPTRLEIPEDFMTVAWVKYDVRNGLNDNPAFTTIPRISPEDFINRQANLSGASSIYDVVTLESGVRIRVRNDHAPTCWTSFNNETIIFDSYNKNVETTIMASKTICYGQQKRVLLLEDDHEVDLPKELSLLLELNTLEYAYDLWKGSTPAKIVHLARKARVRAQRSDNKFRDDFSTGPDYGRLATGRKKPKHWGVGGGIGSSGGGTTPPPVEPPPVVAAGTINIVGSSYTVNENTQFLVVASRTGGSEGLVTVQAWVSLGLATPFVGTIVFPDGYSGTASVQFTTAGVSVDQAATIYLASPTNGAILGTNTSVPLNVLDTDVADPGTINSSISALTIPEGSTFTFVMTRDGGSYGEVSCDWGLQDGIIALTPSSGTHVWEDGNSDPFTVVVTVGEVSSNTSFVFGRGIPVGAYQGTSPTAYGLIATDVTGPGVITFFSPAPVVVEEGATTPVQFVRTGGDNGIVSVRYTVGNNLAIPTTSRVEWQDGDTAPKTVNILAANVTGDQATTIVIDDPRGGAGLGNTTSVNFTVTDIEYGFVAIQPVPLVTPENTVAIIQASRYSGADKAVSVDYTISDSLASPSTGTFEWADGESGIKSITVNTASVTGDQSGTITLSNPQGGLQLGPNTTVQTITVTDTDVGVLTLVAFGSSSIDEGDTIDIEVTRTGGSSGEASCDWVMPGMTPSHGTFTWTDGDSATKSETLTANYIYEDEDGVTRYAHLLNISGAGNGGTVRRNLAIDWVDSVANTTELTVYDASWSGSSGYDNDFATIVPSLPGATQLVTVRMDDIFPPGQASLSSELAWLPNQAWLNDLGTALENAGITEVVLDIEQVAGDIEGTAKWAYGSTNQSVVENCAALWVEVFTYVRETYTGTIGMYDGCGSLWQDYGANLTDPSKANASNAGNAAFLAAKYHAAKNTINWMYAAHDSADFITPSIYASNHLAYNPYNTDHWDPVTGVPETGFDGPAYWAREMADQQEIDSATYRFIDYFITEKHGATKRKIWYLTNRDGTSQRYSYPDGTLLGQMEELTQYGSYDEIAIWSASNVQPPSTGGAWWEQTIDEYTEYTGVGPGTINIAVDDTTINESGTTLTITVSRDGGSQGAASAAVGVNVGGQYYTPQYFIANPTWADGNADDYEYELVTRAVSADIQTNILLTGVTGAMQGTPSSIEVTVVNVPQRGTINLVSTAISGNEQTTQTVEASRSGGSEGPVSVTWTIATGPGGIPLASPTSGTFTWEDGVTTNQTATITLAAVTADVTAGNYLTLADATGGASLGTSTGTVAITNLEVDSDGIINLTSTAPTATVGGTFNITASRDNASGTFGAASVLYSLSNNVGTPNFGTLNWDADEDGVQATTITATNAGTGQILLGGVSGATLGVYQGTATVSATSPRYTFADLNSRHPTINSKFTTNTGVAFTTPTLPSNVTTTIDVTTDGQLGPALATPNRTINIYPLANGATYTSSLNPAVSDQYIVIKPGVKIPSLLVQGTARRVHIYVEDPRNMTCGRISVAGEYGATPEDIILDGVYGYFTGAISPMWWRGRRIAILNSYIYADILAFTFYSGDGPIDGNNKSQNMIIANTFIDNNTIYAVPGGNTCAIRLYNQQNCVVVDSKLTNTHPTSTQGATRTMGGGDGWYMSKNLLGHWGPPTMEYQTGSGPVVGLANIWFENNRVYINTWNNSAGIVVQGIDNTNLTNFNVTNNLFRGKLNSVLGNSPIQAGWTVSGNTVEQVTGPGVVAPLPDWNWNTWQST